ncbi:MAG: proline reductase cluster protein PrdD [Turicibacter sp.]|nr:proline reductase cluster protein PrdD [Turicibacter sp.]
MLEKKLVIKSFHVNQVQTGAKTSLASGVLTVNVASLELAPFAAFIESAEVNVINPYQHDGYVNTIVDIIPIATKALGTLGTGITHTLTGVYVLLTASDTDGGQMTAFGASNGILKEKLTFGQAGSPREEDVIIHVDVTLKSEASYLRQAATAMHQACDTLIQDIRDMLKTLPGHQADERYDFVEKEQTAGMKIKVAIVKQVAGQGAMYDNLLFPDEPSGVAGGMSIIDMNNMPVMLTPNEYRDGALRALT